nr:C40 family peptidase [Enterococcus faecalis]
MSRLGTVVFLVLFNIGISFFVFLLTGIMLFSQILFIIFAMFLPISFLLSMLPTYESLGKKAIVRLFNTIMMRAGVTLVITTAFSISTMFFNISATYPFFMVAFLQIVTFAGIYFKLGDIMSMFNLQSNDSQSMSRRVMRKPQMLMNRKFRQLNRNVGRALAFDGGVAVFFHSTYDAGTYVTHVGIYAGDNRMFHAGDPVGWTNLTETYWQQHIIGAGRYKNRKGDR